MTNKELLDTCREGVLELKEMELQLQLLGHDGRPAGIRAIQPGGVSGTNHPDAASWQVADGMEACIARKREEVETMTRQAMEIMARISQLRAYLIVHRYYLMAETDDQISMQLSLSRTRVTQLRLRCVKAL